MIKKRAGRKPKTQTKDRKEYSKGYSVGWARARRKAEGMIPVTRKIRDKQKSEDYQKGIQDGVQAGRRFYGDGKRK